jgi:hypothetical protein
VAAVNAEPHVVIPLWGLITLGISLLVSFFGAVYAGGKLLLSQVEKRLDERFRIQESARVEAQKHWDGKFNGLESAAGRDAQKWREMERELLQLKAELPEKFVRREDWIRFAAVIDAKQDALAEKINTLNARLERVIGEREK